MAEIVDAHVVLEVRPGKRYFARTDAVSSGVRSVLYDPDQETLDVEFPSGDTYRYYRVRPEEFVALMTSGSLGSHINTHIKARHPAPRKL